MVGSPPPFLAAMMMARLSLLQSLPRLASMAPFLCLIVAQCECPDMAASPKRFCEASLIDASQPLQFPFDLRPAGVVDRSSFPSAPGRAPAPRRRRLRPGLFSRAHTSPRWSQTSGTGDGGRDRGRLARSIPSPRRTGRDGTAPSRGCPGNGCSSPSSSRLSLFRARSSSRARRMSRSASSRLRPRSASSYPRLLWASASAGSSSRISRSCSSALSNCRAIE